MGRGLLAFAQNAQLLFGDQDPNSVAQFTNELLIHTSAGPSISVIFSPTCPEQTPVFDLHVGQVWVCVDQDAPGYLSVQRYNGLEWMTILDTSDLFNTDYFSVVVPRGGPRGITGPKGPPGPVVTGPPGNPGLPGPPGNYIIPYHQIVDRIIVECSTVVHIVGPPVVNLKGKTFPFSVPYKVTVSVGVAPDIVVTEVPNAVISLGDMPAGTPVVLRGQSLIIGHQLGASVSLTLKCVDGSKLSRIRSVPTRLQVLLNPDSV